MIIPSEEIYRQTSTVRGLFLRWTDFMYHRIHFNIPDSKLRSASHCERGFVNQLAHVQTIM